MRSLALFALLIISLTPLTAAQRAASAHAAASSRSAGSHFNAATGGRGFAFGRGARASSRFSRSSPYGPYSSLGFPFFGDAFDPSDIYSTGYPVAAEPPAFVLQAAQEMLAAGGGSPRSEMISRDQHEPQSSQPLVIELQGGRYVRVTHAAIDGETLGPNISSIGVQAAAATGSPSNRPALTADAARPDPASDLAPAVLVFRDGHSEEVRDYTIADGVLYVRGDYYTDGYWNKKIELSSLDLSQTLQANNERDVKFILPSSPNQVITRP